MTKNMFTHKRGFALAELAISMLVLTILAGVVVPNYVYGLRQEATKKTALEVNQIQEASRKFYIDNNAWPASVAALKTAGYLDSTWTANNPFGNAYSLSSVASQLSVNVDVPADMVSLLVSNLPMATNPSGNTVQSDVPVPGGAVSGVPVGAIIPLGTATIPSGWLLCNGQAVDRVAYAALFSAIGTTFGAGNGSTTFNVPNLKGKTVVGYDSTQAEFNVLGFSGGAKTVNLAHTHTVPHDGWGSVAPAQEWNLVTGRLARSYISSGDVLSALQTGNDNVSGSAGSAAQSVLNPYTVANWIIKT